jgi:hypothetical protein
MTAWPLKRVAKISTMQASCFESFDFLKDPQISTVGHAHLCLSAQYAHKRFQVTKQPVEKREVAYESFCVCGVCM